MSYVACIIFILDSSIKRERQTDKHRDREREGERNI